MARSRSAAASTPSAATLTGYRPSAASRRSASPISTGSKRMDRSITELFRAELWGDSQGVVDSSLPIGQVVKRVVGHLTDKDEKLDWHVLGMVWERLEGRIPDRLEVEATIRGVIALPVLRASEMDWSADAVSVLAETPRAAPVYELPAAAVRVDDVVDAVASLSPDEDD